ncbi:differentially expressed in FDCP 8 homolog [Arctopsyche grandis]|uniref:differentially expressed in FDCP 8 homolog n=1 Tax=Arctopsyche grandis TaxID=121162 RepID=UPI00406D6C89
MDSEASSNRFNTLFESPSAIFRTSPGSSTSTSDIVSMEDDVDFLFNKRLTLAPDASLSELKDNIEKCKVLISESDECSSERKWLVRHLIELRIRVQQLEDVDENLPVARYSTMGHHFELQKNSTRKQYCDNCSSAMWNVMQGSYVCKDCNYKCHVKCVDNVSRICVHVVASENNELVMSICPEKGLAAQQYKCAECKTHLGVVGETQRVEPRLCDYSGLYYCNTCHWNNECEIPARVVHNWDWEKRQVSQAAYQLLSLTKNTNLINLDTSNEKLYNFVTELDYARKMRNDLKVMMKYLVACKKGNALVNGEMVNLAETPKLYSMAILESVREGQFENKLTTMAENCRLHITQCQTCSGKGYLCELCGNNEIIFPFDSSAVGCSRCNSYFHRVCWTKKQYVCPKCARLEKRNVSEDLDKESCTSDDECENEVKTPSKIN